MPYNQYTAIGTDVQEIYNRQCVLVQNILIPANEHAVHLVLPTEDLPDHLAVAAFVC